MANVPDSQLQLHYNVLFRTNAPWKDVRFNIPLGYGLNSTTTALLKDGFYFK